MLDKLTLRYDAIEDRMALTLHVHNPSGPERRVLQLTRRLCATWRADMAAMLQLAQTEPQSIYPARKPPAQPQPATADPAATASAAPTGTAAPDTPVDAAPVLVTRITAGRRRADGRWLLKFQLRDRPAFSLTLSDRALQDLMDALQRQLQRVNWALPPVAAAPAQGQPVRPSSLH